MRALGTEETPSAAPPPAAAPPTPATPAPEQPEYTGLRDYAKTELGIELPFEDDRSAFQQLVNGWQQSQRSEPYQPYIAEYLQNQQQYNAWKQEQAQSRAPKQEPLWNPPASRDEVQALMASYYQRAEDGSIKPKTDCPMDVRQKVEGYARYTEAFQQKFQSDPMAAIQPFIQQAIQPMLAQQAEQMRENYAATQALAQHSQWLYEPNTQNQKLTPAGEIYKSYLVDGEKKGIKGVEFLDDYALKMTHATLISQQAQKPTTPEKPAPAPQTRNERFSQNNNRRPSVGSAVANGQAPPVDRKGMGLGEQMRSALKAAGVDAGTEEARELGLAN